MWDVDSSKEYDAWFVALDEECKEAVLERFFLLTGGDKKGKDQDKFYKDLVAESVTIIERHEKELTNERRNKKDGKQNVR